MSCETHCCVLTRGEFFISDWQRACEDGSVDFLCGSKDGFKKLGNISSCVINVTNQILGKENEFNTLEDTSARTMVEGVDITITMTCASKNNLYRALYGLKLEADSGTHYKEYCFNDLNDCYFFPFERNQADLGSVVVTLKDIEGITVKTLTLGVDYSISNSGVQIIKNDIDLNNGTTIILAYDYDNESSYEIDFLSQYQGYKSIYFKGTNYIDDSKNMFDAYFNKVLLAPIKDFDLITGDDFFTITLSGSVEKDNGQWYKITKKE